MTISLLHGIGGTFFFCAEKFCMTPVQGMTRIIRECRYWWKDLAGFFFQYVKAGRRALRVPEVS